MAILQNEIEKAKDKLKDVNENIKKLTGRDPVDLSNSRPGRGRQTEARGRGRLFSLARRGIMPEETSGPLGLAARRFGRGAFSRLGPMPARRREREDSGDEDEPPSKLSVHSSVIATSKDTRSRQDTLVQQSKDREGLLRNRRMFGLLLGTLQKFKSEASQQDQKAEQRKVIEKKLEEKAEKEKKRYIQETQLLIEESQLEQAKITRLQQKMELVSEHETQTNEMKKLYNFISTRVRPRIFYKPKQMNPSAEIRLKESKKIVDKLIAEKSKALEQEISEIMEREHEREERLRSRLRIDKENEDDVPVQEEIKPEFASKDHKDSHRKSHDKKDGHRHGHSHKEAKKRQQEMQYDDGEEEVEMVQEEVSDRKVEGKIASKGRKRESKESHGGEEGRGGEDKAGDKGVKRKETDAEKEKRAEKSAAQILKESIENDGHHTDVDYEDDESSSSSSDNGSEDEEKEGRKKDGDNMQEEMFGGRKKEGDNVLGGRKKDGDKAQEEMLESRKDGDNVPGGRKKDGDNAQEELLVGRKEDGDNEQEEMGPWVLEPAEKDGEHQAVPMDYILSADTLAAIPMPGEPVGNDHNSKQGAESDRLIEGTDILVTQLGTVHYDGGDMNAALEARRRQAVMPEDAEEGMDNEPAADE